MHQSAKVWLEYLFIPDTAQPDIYFQQNGAPSPLEFRAPDLFSEIIDPAKLELIEPPKK